MTPQESFLDALNQRDYAAAEQALQAGAVLDERHVLRSTTPFFVMATKGFLEQARWLADRGADVNTVDANGDTILMNFIERNRWNDFEEAMALGVDVDKANHRGITPVLRAALFRHGLPYLEKLLAAGANPNTTSNVNTTALMAAVAEGYQTMAERLFDAGASPLGMDEYGQNIFTAAVLSGDPRILKLVLDRTQALRASGQLDVNHAGGNGSKPIARAAGFSAAMVLLLLRAGGDPNAQSKNQVDEGIMPLMLLAYEDSDGEASWVKEALAAGANPNVRDRSGNNVIAYALANGLDGKRAVLTALLDAGLDPRAPIGAGGGSPLLQALRYEQGIDDNGHPIGPTQPQVVEALLAMGFPSLPPMWRQPGKAVGQRAPFPLVAALSNRNLASAKVILDHGEPVNTLADTGESVLHQMGTITGLSLAEMGAVMVTRRALEKNRPKSDAELSGQGAQGPATEDTAKRAAAREQVDALDATGLAVVATAAQWLTDQGADWGLRSADGLTPLMAMARCNGWRMLGQVVRYHGGDLGATDSQGWTAADHALHTQSRSTLDAIVGHLSTQPSGLAPIAGLLLNAAYASPEVVPDDPDSFARRSAFFDLLATVPADPLLLEARDDHHNTPLIVAAATGQDDMVRLLLAMGANPKAANHAGETALLHAVSGGEPQADIVRLLRACGADVHQAAANGSIPREFVQSRGTRMAAALNDPDPADRPELPELTDEDRLHQDQRRRAWAGLQPATGAAPAVPPRRRWGM